MSLSLDLASAVAPLTGQSFAPPQTVTVSDAAVTLSVDLLAVDLVGVACEELRLDVPALAAATLQTMKKWGEGLCQRITYLLENLGPLEYDAQANEVLIRSAPPDTSSTPGQTKYYEVLLSSQGSGRFSLRRYQADRSTGNRTAVPLRITHEQLAKLVNDLTATLPGP